MKQLSQEMKKGTMHVEDVPDPSLGAGGVVVRTQYSLISAGTERTSVSKRKSSLLSKVRSNPEMLKVVTDQMKNYGIVQTYKKVMNKLESYAPLGYSSAGTVVAVADDIEDFVPGDRVACAGAGYANHAELVFVPKNLCAKLPSEVSFQEGAFTTVGTIALQGVRQAAPTLGETVAVIGLGLVGQLTVQLLKAAGCSVIGIDLDSRNVALAKTMGANAAFKRMSPGAVQDVRSFTRGYGADAVIITAATKNNDPVELAGLISREKGRVIIVGDVGLSLPRDSYYLKELDIKLSRSYGPGRYDALYEEKGLDYPIGYVRWTEKRNMEEFLTLVEQKKVNVGALTTHVFTFADAPKAYNIITGKTPERYVGVLLEYPEAKPGPKSISVAPAQPTQASLSIGFIGAGNFAQSSLLPYLKAKNVAFKSVCTARGLNAKNVARQFGFERATTDPKEIYASEMIDTVFIATRHNLHASLCVQAIKNFKHVFVEKPLALNDAELDQIVSAHNAAMKKSNLRFMVGFNRRFAPSVREAKKFFEAAGQPMVINYRVNAGYLPKDHWSQDLIEGGGRIIGEVCHFIDTIQFITGGMPQKVFAQSLSTSGNYTQSDNVAITVRFNNAAVGVITYLANGDASVPKERIEMFAAGKTAVIENFKRLETYHGNTRKVKDWSVPDKGHRAEMEEFIESIHLANDLIPFESLIATTRATFRIIDSLETGRPVEV
jgi:predicted dehydrogenase/threonine dehydrogenase-like Zn-dependent dehydrogenase